VPGDDRRLERFQRAEGVVAAGAPDIVGQVQLPDADALLVRHVLPAALLELQQLRDVDQVEELRALSCKYRCNRSSWLPAM
jgi:hypothetical protein